MAKFFKKAISLIEKYCFNSEWRCLVCGEEIFEGKFCAKCNESLPLNDGAICEHCGRKVKVCTPYCLTCKNELTEVDKCRSAFCYLPPINKLIYKAKYGGERYLLKCFSEYLVPLYYKNYFNADFVTFVPMTKKAKRKRGYNQSELLAKHFAKAVNLQVVECLTKTKETQRQATLTKIERMKNLIDCFKVIDKKVVQDKSVLIIDDVTTTGATAQALSIKLKKSGAKAVYLLTIASVGAKQGY